MGKKKKSNIGPLRTVLQVTLANDHPVKSAHMLDKEGGFVHLLLASPGLWISWRMLGIHFFLYSGERQP